MNSDFLDIQNKRVFVSGASSGIGKAVCKLLSEHGATIIMNGRNEGKLFETMQSLGKGSHSFITGDITDPDVRKEISKKAGQLDGIVHSAGVLKYLPSRVINDKHLKEVFDINFFAPMQLNQQLLFDKRINKNGSIVFVSSISGIGKTAQGLSIYSGSKSALVSSTKVLALELAKSKIRVNSIAPGMVNTEMINPNNTLISKCSMEEDQKKYPLGYGESIDVANLVAFLLSSRSKWITGSTIVIDGGFSCC